MSKFSDKSDFADTCLMHYSPNRVFYANISVNGVPLKLTSPKDLIPYYGHGISSMSSSKNGSMSITLTKESLPDMNDKERIQIIVDDYVYLARKAKRQKKDVALDDFINTASSWITNSNKDPLLMEVFSRCEKIKKLLLKYWTIRAWTYDKIENKTEKHLIDLSIIDNNFYGLHTSTSNYYRENLLKYAAPFFGKFYTDFQSKAAFDPDAIWNGELLDIKRKVMEYHSLEEKKNATGNV